MREEVRQDTPFTLLYDERCPLCRATVRGALRLARPGTVLAAGLRSWQAEQLLRGKSLDERLEAFHLVAPGGHHWKGPDALAPLFDLLPPLRPVAWVLRRSATARRLAGAIYHWVARSRPQLSRFIPRSWSRPLPEGGRSGEPRSRRTG